MGLFEDRFHRRPAFSFFFLFFPHLLLFLNVFLPVIIRLEGSEMLIPQMQMSL